MLRYIVFLFCIVLPTTFISCGEDPGPDPELILSTGSLSFVNNGEEKFFHIKANMDWSVSSSDSWLTLSPVNGSSGTIKVIVTAAANTTTEVRNATITAKVGTLTETIAVSQGGAHILTVSQNEFEVAIDGNEITFQVQSSGTYEVEIDSEWIQPAGGTANEPVYSILPNPSMINRLGKITLSLEGLIQEVEISQEANMLTLPADNTGMIDDPMTLAQKMGIGWNLGNTLEASSTVDENGVSTASELLWGNPKASQALMDAVKAAGFNTVRIPCAWNGYIEDHTTNKIKDSWLLRVREVVDYCVANDMYAIINIHWDGGWLEEHPLYSHQVAVNKKQKELWEQIAVAFRNYDEHLLFAGTNEVHANYGTPTAEHIEVQESYNQTFIDAVRSTGGRNTYRNLIVQGYNTNIGHTDDFMTLPTDPTDNRMMAEIHFYDPFDFTLDQSSNKYYWGADFAGLGNTSTWGQEAWVDSEFARMKVKFIDNNIPVIMGEYGPMRRGALTGQTLVNHLASRNHYLYYVTKAALDNGIVPVYWDNGPMGNNSSGLFNRTAATPADVEAIEAIISALE